MKREVRARGLYELGPIRATLAQGHTGRSLKSLDTQGNLDTQTGDDRYFSGIATAINSALQPLTLPRSLSFSKSLVPNAAKSLHGSPVGLPKADSKCLGPLVDLILSPDAIYPVGVTLN